MTNPATHETVVPQPPRLRLVPAPGSGIPYDDELPDRRRTRVRAAPQSDRHGTQGTLALAFPLPSGVPAVPTPSPRLRIVGRGLAQRAGSLSAVASATIGRPDVSRWVALIAQAIIEAEVGDRPVTQLARWTTEDVYAAIADRRTTQSLRSAGTRRTTARALVASVHICPIDEDVVEACATVRCAARARTVAFRLEGVGSMWRCTAISLG